MRCFLCGREMLRKGDVLTCNHGRDPDTPQEQEPVERGTPIEDLIQLELNPDGSVGVVPKRCELEAEMRGTVGRGRAKIDP